MWKVYDAQDGDSVYESEFIEDCAVFVADKEKPERFHIVGGMKAPVWNIEGGLNELAAADVEMFILEVLMMCEGGDSSLSLNDMVLAISWFWLYCH